MGAGQDAQLVALLVLVKADGAHVVRVTYTRHKEGREGEDRMSMKLGIDVK